MFLCIVEIVTLQKQNWRCRKMLDLISRCSYIMFRVFLFDHSLDYPANFNVKFHFIFLHIESVCFLFYKRIYMFIRNSEIFLKLKNQSKFVFFGFLVKTDARKKNWAHFCLFFSNSTPFLFHSYSFYAFFRKCDSVLLNSLFKCFVSAFEVMRISLKEGK